MKNVLIAGGTGFIGRSLVIELESAGYKVKVLSRRDSAKPNTVKWNPETKEFPINQIQDTEILINLCGEGIAEKRWTEKRRDELIHSRVDVTNTLFELGKQLPRLEQYISASGINAYGFDDGLQIHEEQDEYGSDFVSQLVKKWESAADQFKAIVPVTKLRIALVLGRNGGALKALEAPINFGVKGVVGNGIQQVSWVHIDDLTRLFRFAASNKLDGVYNTNAENCSNYELMTALCKARKKKTWWTYIPRFVLKLVLGESSDIVLKGARASNEKIKNEGFSFQFDTLDKALQSIYWS